jgi:large subunit ribosomal protein L4
MKLKLVNGGAKGSEIELSDATFGREYNEPLVHQVLTANAAAGRAGTKAQLTKSEVRGGGKKPWRQKGTGRARVGETRNPLWRKGGTVFGPQPRSYDYQLPKKVEKAALRAAISQRLQDGDLVVVDALTVSEARTKAAAALLKGLGVSGKTLLLDVKPEAGFTLAARNLAGVRLVPTNRVTARDVMDSRKVVATRAALEKLQEVLA